MLLPGNKRLADASPTGTEEVIVEEPVIYTNTVNTTVNSDFDLEINVESSGNSISYVYGANSQQVVNDGEYIEWVVNTPTNQNRTFVGLSFVDGGTSYYSIKYSWYLYHQLNQAYVFNYNTNISNVNGANITYSQGSVFRIERNGTNIVFILDGVVYETLTESNTSTPMIVDIGMVNIQGVLSKVEDLVIGKLTTINTYAPQDYVAASFSQEDYRYSFQGQEHDDEVKGKGNSINYKYRMHDPRIGRFFAIDPLASKYPYYTPYSFSGNKVIANVELEGLETGPSESESTESDSDELKLDNPGLENPFQRNNGLDNLLTSNLQGENQQQGGLGSSSFSNISSVSSNASSVKGPTYWRPLTANKLDLKTGLTSSTSGFVLEDAWNRWASSSWAFSSLGYVSQTSGMQYYSKAWSRSVAFDGQSFGFHVDVKGAKSSVNTGIAFYEVKRVGKKTLQKNYRNIGAQISAISENFKKQVKNESAFYYLVTTTDVENVSSIKTYAEYKGLTFGHYVPYYGGNSEGTLVVKFMARVPGFFSGYSDIDVFLGNDDGVPLINP